MDRSETVRRLTLCKSTLISLRSVERTASPDRKCFTIIGDRNYDGTLRGSGGKGTSGGGSGGEDVCFTAPFIHCPENSQFDKYTPLWNAHIHSKNLEKYVSQPCPCR